MFRLCLGFWVEKFSKSLLFPPTFTSHIFRVFFQGLFKRVEFFGSKKNPERDSYFLFFLTQIVFDVEKNCTLKASLRALNYSKALRNQNANFSNKWAIKIGNKINSLYLGHLIRERKRSKEALFAISVEFYTETLSRSRRDKYEFDRKKKKKNVL